MKSRKTQIELIRFLFIGGINTLLTYLLFLLFYSFGLHYALALTYVSIITITHAYLWQRYWVFKSSNKIPKELAKFISVYGASFIFNLLFLSLLVETLKIDPRVGEIIALGIAAVLTFSAQKYWSFAHKSL